MNLFNPLTYMFSIYIVGLLIAVYVDCCSLRGKKSLIWSSLQNELKNYRDRKSIVIARLPIKIVFILILLDMVYLYAVHIEIKNDIGIWLLMALFSIAAVNEMKISYRNDVRGMWSKIYRHILILPAIMLCMVWQLLFG